MTTVWYLDGDAFSQYGFRVRAWFGRTLSTVEGALFDEQRRVLRARRGVVDRLGAVQTDSHLVWCPESHRDICLRWEEGTMPNSIR